MTTTLAAPPHIDTTGPRPFTGWGTLARLHLRRDRILLAVWALGLAAFPTAVVAATRAAHPDQASRDQFIAGSTAIPSQLAMRGPIFDSSVGALTAWTVASSGSLITGLVAAVLVVRYTRTEEQNGRQELTSAGRVGRLAPLTAGLAVTASTSFVLGGLMLLGLLSAGMPSAGSWVLSGAVAGTGWVFAGVGALAAQLAESSAGARGIGLIVLGMVFALAAVGDLSSSSVVWLSPIGWTRHAEAYAANHGWVIILQLALSIALCTVATLIAARRDLGRGALQVRSGPVRAPGWLVGPVTLAWHRQRGMILGWAAGLGGLGVLLGTVVGGVSSQLDSPAFRELAARIGGADVGQVFFQFVIYVLVQVVSAAALISILALRTDESAGLAEMILVRHISRTRWAIGQLVVTLAFATVVLLAIGIGAGLSSGQLPGLIGTTLAYVPACAVVVGLAIALFGWVPRLAVPASWTILGLIVLLDLLGEFELISPELMLLSPYAAIFTALITQTGLGASFGILLAIAAGLSAFGLIGLSRRDLQTS